MTNVYDKEKTLVREITPQVENAIGCRELMKRKLKRLETGGWISPRAHSGLGSDRLPNRRSRG